MTIYVDADACPVKEIIVELAKEFNIKVIYVYDTAHIINDDYAQSIIVSKGSDNADFKLLSLLSSSDLLVTQDYGLASLALLKCKYVINQNGLIYSEDNINELLTKRYLGKKERKINKHIKGPKKRSAENDVYFRKTLYEIIKKSDC